MRYKITGSCGENYEIEIDFGFIEAGNGSQALDILWNRLQKTDVVKVKSREDLNRCFSVQHLPVLSEPYQLVQKLSKKCWKSGGDSYVRLNAALRLVLQSAIIAGMKFELDDINQVASNFNGGYWFSDDDGEWIFRCVIENNNLSACLSFENYKGRKPFIFEGERMFVGRQFYWYDPKKDGHLSNGYHATCTSFPNSDYFIACSYKYGNKNGFPNKTIEKRFKITWDDLAGKRETVKAQKKKALKK